MSLISATPIKRQCQAILTRGTDKGKRCFESDEECKHTMRHCHLCNVSFNFDSTFQRHMDTHSAAQTNTPAPMAQAPPVPVRKITPIDQLSHTSKQLIAMCKNPIPKSEATPQQQTRLSVKKATPAPDNCVFSNFYATMLSKYGRESTLKLLKTSASGFSILSKLYENGYPIVFTKPDVYRYLLEDGLIYEEHGGQVLGKLLANRLCDTYMLAASDVINSSLRGGGQMQDLDYELFHGMQQRATEIKEPNQITMLLRDLSTATNNQRHSLLGLEARPASCYAPVQITEADFFMTSLKNSCVTDMERQNVVDSYTDDES